MTKTCIGIDVGRSAVKGVGVAGDDRIEMVFPAAFSPAIRITDDSAAAKAALETVSIKGKEYFVGDTALLQGRDEMISGLNDDWAFSDQHAALILATIKRFEAAGVPGTDSALIAVGLPARLYATQRKNYAAAVSELIPKAEIRVVPQPMGPYYTMLFDENGRERPGFDDSSWAIIEIGQYTTDFAMIDRGHVIERAFDSCDGMRMAAQALQQLVLSKHKINLSLAQATDLMIKPEIKSFGQLINVQELVLQSVQPLAKTIADKARQVFGESARSMDGIRLAGGGAILVRDALSDSWAQISGQAIAPSFVTVIENSRFAVAEGFCRFAVGLEAYRNAGQSETVAEA